MAPSHSAHELPQSPRSTSEHGANTRPTTGVHARVKLRRWLPPVCAPSWPPGPARARASRLRPRMVRRGSTAEAHGGSGDRPNPFPCVTQRGHDVMHCKRRSSVMRGITPRVGGVDHLGGRAIDQTGRKRGEKPSGRAAPHKENPRFTGVSEADEGTRTLDLLHGKCERPFASVRAGSLKPADCRVSRPSERTRANPSERRNLAILATPAKASGHGPHVGDVLLNRHREHRRALFLIRSDPKRTLLRCVGEHQRLNARASQFARARERSSNLPTVSTAVRSHSSVRIRDRRRSRVY
jgi:hypothetical protein